MNRREAIGEALRIIAPRLPAFETDEILARALASPGLRSAQAETAAWLSLVAFARHSFTEYDSYLDDGYDRDSARHFILDELNETLRGWGVSRRVTEETNEADEA